MHFDSLSGTQSQDIKHESRVYQVQEAAIHNHLLALYAEQEKDREMEMERQRRERGEDGIGGGPSPYSLEVLESSPLLKFLSRPPNQRCFDVKCVRVVSGSYIYIFASLTHIVRIILNFEF